MCCTAGCESTTALSRSCAAIMAGKETSWGPSENPASCPVFCCGKSPLGTTTYRAMLAAAVAAVAISTGREWRSTQRSDRSYPCSSAAKPRSERR